MEALRKSQTPKVVTLPKKDGMPKIILGTGRHLAYVSDTLFDDDLKR